MPRVLNKYSCRFGVDARSYRQNRHKPPPYRCHPRSQSQVYLRSVMTRGYDRALSSRGFRVEMSARKTFVNKLRVFIVPILKVCRVFKVGKLTCEELRVLPNQLINLFLTDVSAALVTSRNPEEATYTKRTTRSGAIPATWDTTRPPLTVQKMQRAQRPAHREARPPLRTRYRCKQHPDYQKTAMGRHDHIATFTRQNRRSAPKCEGTENPWTNTSGVAHSS